MYIRRKRERGFLYIISVPSDAVFIFEGLSSKYVLSGQVSRPGRRGDSCLVIVS